MDDKNSTRDAAAKPSFGEKIRAGWWPDIDTPLKARKATMLGAYAIIIVIAITALFILIMPDFFGDSDVIVFVVGELVIFAIIGFFIWRNSRIAAIAGLVLFVADRLVQLGSGEISGAAIIITIALAFMFINSVRGTFAHHKLTTQQRTIN